MKMEVKELINNLQWLRDDIIGRNVSFETPFGKKPLVYADYTASGRALNSLEKYVTKILNYYANTHTEDDFTGKIMTTLLHKSEHIIKNSVNAGKEYKIIFYDSGTTGGITRLQQILGIYIPPASKNFLKNILHQYDTKTYEEFADFYRTQRPVVFVGPYEHHSNELTWREALCEVIEIPLGKDGLFDLNALEKIVSEKKYENRKKIGSFSAASNVSGVLSPTYQIAEIMHKYNGFAFFDFAACAPYVKIDMNKDNKSYYDAIFLSPHKFLGGPSTAGILIFNKKLYNENIPPTISGGGTVDYVNSSDVEYTKDIELREKPGTPGIIQDIKISFLFQLKEKIGLDNIEKIEKFYLKRFYEHFKNNDKIEFYGPTHEDKKIAIIPFNIKHRDKILHPRFVTKLLNDLFGIQTRAGCSCAGPYGHILLNINEKTSHYYRCAIGVDHMAGLKPGWVRLNLHYSISEEEFNYIIKAIDFAIEHAYKFLQLYEIDFLSGDWKHIEEKTKFPVELDIEKVYKNKNNEFTKVENEKQIYEKTYNDAIKIMKTLPTDFKFKKIHPSMKRIMFFDYINSVNDYVPKLKSEIGK